MMDLCVACVQRRSETIFVNSIFVQQFIERATGLGHEPLGTVLIRS